MRTQDGEIAAITDKKIRGNQAINTENRVVAPEFRWSECGDCA
jgi:hypothetical protein